MARASLRTTPTIMPESVAAVYTSVSKTWTGSSMSCSAVRASPSTWTTNVPELITSLFVPMLMSKPSVESPRTLSQVDPSKFIKKV